MYLHQKIWCLNHSYHCPDKRYQQYCRFHMILQVLKRNNEHEKRIMEEVIKHCLKGIKIEDELYECTLGFYYNLQTPGKKLEDSWIAYVTSLKDILSLPIGISMQIENLGELFAYKESESITRQLFVCLELVREELELQNRKMKEKKQLKIAGSCFVSLTSMLLFL